MADKLEQPPEEWTESQVSSWLMTIGVNDQYIKKLFEEEVDGRILLELTEEYLKKDIGMKSGPALLLIRKRNALVESQQKHLEGGKGTGSHKSDKGHQRMEKITTPSVPDTDKGDPAEIHKKHQAFTEESQTDQQQFSGITKKDCKPRPFDKDSTDFTYIKHSVLQPECGVFDLINPCHEFKSFTTAATLDRTRLQAKFAREVLKFGSGCMNVRSNGTIHFGVMDSRDDAGYVHGEIIGVPVEEKDIYVDALDHIERSFSRDSDREDVRQCIRPPRFIEVMDITGTERRYVVEVDIVSSISTVKSRVYSVRLPNFKESSNKVEYEKETIYRRMGSRTEPVIDKDQNDFYRRVKDRDAVREEAEKRHFLHMPDICQDLGRKLTMRVTSGKKFIKKEKWYILVTNKFKPEDLCFIDWLLNLNIFCVFDFDPDSKISGFCSKYIQHHAANMHFMHSYRMPNGMDIAEFVKKLHLFEQTSWIFCNGRTDYKGSETPCDEMTWIKTKLTLLKESVSLICKQVLPKGTFQVIFLLTSPAEKPLLHTFLEFFTDMEGHDNITCICESQEFFQKWQSFAEASCEKETVNRSSIVGMKMSHVDVTVQQIQPVTSIATKYLPVFARGQCCLEKPTEERMHSLEVLGVNHCNETNEEYIKAEKENIECQFYHGGKVAWLNFWLAEKGHVEGVIQRDAHNEVSKLLNDTLKGNADQNSVQSINIYHHPGSGGSTVARQVLWNNRKELRCAVVKPSYSASVVAEHAVELREYEENDPQKCVPVLLLIEDSDSEYLDDLRYELDVKMNTKRINHGSLCFILLSCRRSLDPEKRCSESPLQNVAVTHKLSGEEKNKFARKRKILEESFRPEFILTFVLMCEEFNHQKIEEYVEQFVKHLLQDIDRESLVTRLILYVALLNTYVQNSFISQSHCEALLTLTIHMERFRRHMFEGALSEPAKLVFLHLKDDKTHIELVKIIHPLVAKEILQQLLGGQKSQSQLALDLLCETTLFEHRFGKEDYLAFLRALFMRRCRISKGDETDSFFSPLIEHVCEYETPEKAIELLKEAYLRFNKDAYFAQQLARLHYTYERFEEAKHWAEIAAKQKPRNSIILNTKGQVYWKWFNAKCKAFGKVQKTAHNITDALNTALTAMECFRDCQEAALSDNEDIHISGFSAEVEVGCSLLKLILSLKVFSKQNQGHSECMKYLLTDYIPEEVKVPWEPFHDKLKNLQKTIRKSLDWISEHLSYFQTHISTEEEETTESPEMKISNPLNWLVKKTREYGKLFSVDINHTALKSKLSPTNVSPFMKRMIICHLGGGNMTSILSILAELKQEDAVKHLETMLSLYPSDPLKARLDQLDLVNYIMANVALNCLCPQSPKVAALKDLQKLSEQFPTDKKQCIPSALFLLTMLFWPEDNDTNDEKETKYEIVQSAIEQLKTDYFTKIKDIPPRKKRIYTHFFLSKGSGLDRLVHKSKIQTYTKDFTVFEKRMKWHRAEAWKIPEITKMLKCVSGWTEDGVLYLEGPRKKKFRVPALNVRSVPYDNENVTFYLGFTFRGPVAHNITVQK